MNVQPEESNALEPVPAPVSRKAARRNRTWLGVFAVLAVLGLCAITIPIVYNLQTQLTAQQVAEARARWAQNEPRDYTLEYEYRSDGPQEQYVLEVRDGKAVSARKGAERVDPAACPFQTITDLFDFIEKRLQADAAPGARRTYARAVFHKEGHPLRYVRRIVGTYERVEVNVRLRRLDEKTAAPTTR